MNKIYRIFAVTALFALMTCAASFAGEAKQYVNARFGFSVVVPAGLTMLPAPANDDGRTFVNKKDGLEIVASGSNNVMMADAMGSAEMSVPEGIKAAVKSDPAKSAKEVTLRWDEKGDVFWHRVILVTTPEDGDGVFISVYAKYPKANEKKCLGSVQATLKSLKPTKAAK